MNERKEFEKVWRDKWCRHTNIPMNCAWWGWEERAALEAPVQQELVDIPGCAPHVVADTPDHAEALAKALERMLDEFRDFDLPYGSTAYVVGNLALNEYRASKKGGE